MTRLNISHFAAWLKDTNQDWHTLTPLEQVLAWNRWLCADTSQTWFWTAEWQAGEREADGDLKHGRYQVFDSGEDFINALLCERTAV